MIRRLLALVLVTALACGGRDAPGDDARPSSPATLEILEPQPGATIEGSVARVKVSLSGATVLEQATTDIKPDEGHIHISVDGKIVSLLAGLESEVKDLQPGTHVLEAEFVAGDHAPWNPRIVKQTAFTVR